MSTDLSTEVRQPLINVSALARNQHATNESLSTEIKTSNYLPYMKLYGSNSNEVKDGVIDRGHYGMVDNQKLVDLGAELQVIPISWRWKAVRIIGEQFETFFNPTTNDFKSIKLEAEKKTDGHLFGPEVLLWLPSQSKFATWHMNNTSARREAGNLTNENILGKPVKLGWRLASTKKYKWEAPTVIASSTPIDNVPEADLLEQVVTTFANPKDSVITSATTEQQQATESDRR